MLYRKTLICFGKGIYPYPPGVRCWWIRVRCVNFLPGGYPCLTLLAIDTYLIHVEFIANQYQCWVYQQSITIWSMLSLSETNINVEFISNHYQFDPCWVYRKSLSIWSMLSLSEITINLIHVEFIGNRYQCWVYWKSLSIWSMLSLSEININVELILLTTKPIPAVKCLWITMLLTDYIDPRVIHNHH
jgi:hypothetical protein